MAGGAFSCRSREAIDDVGGQRKAATILAGGLAATVGIFFIVLFLIKLLWAWTILDLFPGAVEEGLVAASV